jgi:hypothetical protein
MVFPLRDLSNASPGSAYEASFAYSMADIDRIAAPMGIPWERSKDIPFSTVIRYIGLEWDIARHTVALPHDKRKKYHAAISNWTARTTHTLDQVQSLYCMASSCHYPGGPGLPNASGNFYGKFPKLTLLTSSPQRHSHRPKLVVLLANPSLAAPPYTRPHHPARL